jgi:hypothetical protein
MPMADALQLSADLSALAGYANDIINDPNVLLTNAQTTQLNDFNTELTGHSNQIATNTALSALGAAQAELDVMTAATKQANAKVAMIKADAKKLHTVLSILPLAVSFGACLVGGGVLADVLGAASQLKIASA